MAQPTAGATLRRLGGVDARRRRVALAARLDEQAAQAEHLRLVVVEHGVEGGLRAGAVAADLRRLGAEQQRKGRVAKQSLRVAGVASRRRGIACPDGDHAARHRRKAARAPARPRRERDQVGQLEHEAHERPGRHDGEGERRDADQRHRHRCGDAMPEPDDLDFARPVGEPGGHSRHDGEQRDEDEGADHLTGGSCRARLASPSPTSFWRAASVATRPLRRSLQSRDTCRPPSGRLSHAAAAAGKSRRLSAASMRATTAPTLAAGLLVDGPDAHDALRTARQAVEPTFVRRRRRTFGQDAVRQLAEVARQ